ncbi:MAG: division/cell wall cluster transcriptional repressor MraZ [Lachnospiraceae bacterium]|nr:division/cell wall cluster transcriptional repressor MraZ [Lachnospiraceae bacterium]
MAELFTGEYHHALDTKGRLIVPARFRDILGSQFKIGVSLDPCLTIYSNEGWENFYEGLQSLPANSQKMRRVVRYFTAGTFDVELDKQGRILLPQQLRQLGKIDKNVVFAGFGSRAELWGEEEYMKTQAAEAREDINAIAEELLESGFRF